MNVYTVLSCRVAAPLICVFLASCASEPKTSGRVETHPQPAPVTAERQRTSRSLLETAAAKPSLPLDGDDWQSLFDGKSLKGWSQTDFGGHADIQCESGLMVLNMGDPFTGVNWTNDFPKVNYEVALDAMRESGSDFFCALTVPVKDSFCSLIVGGWGGSLVGISSLDGLDASENETTRYINFEQGRWYRIRLRITSSRIEAWIDNEKQINVDISDKKISLRPGEIEQSKPFGIASWQTTSALRGIRMRRVDAPAGPLK